ncbi:MAG: 30S ribosomal protein S20 [Chitinispirillaceae bacterium]|nr:30S ribosomal protein S20 [Chitinispirillaceae bacterium]
MQRHKSVEKRNRQNKKLRLINRERRSRLATATKKVLMAKDPNKAIEQLKEAFSVIDKCVKSGLIHKNKAANRKSKLSKKINELLAAAKK